MRSISRIALVLSVFAAGSLIAAEPKVYKWTDDDGTIHFSAEPPAAAAAEEVKLDKPPTVVPPEATTIAQTQAPATAEENAKRCEQHRANLKLLENPATPLSIDDNGTMRELTAKERIEQVEAARRALGQCEAAAPAATTTPATAPAPAAK